MPIQWTQRARRQFLSIIDSALEDNPSAAEVAQGSAPCSRTLCRSAMPLEEDHLGSPSDRTPKKCSRADNALLLPMLIESKMRSTFRNVQYGSLAA